MATLLAHYYFSTSSDVGLDYLASGSSKNLSTSGDMSLDTTNFKYGDKSVLFSNSNGYLYANQSTIDLADYVVSSVGDSPLQGFSIAFWIKINGVNTNDINLLYQGKNRSDNSLLHIVWTGNQIKFDFWNDEVITDATGANALLSRSNYTDWVHLAFTCNGSGHRKIYFNGVEKASSTADSYLTSNSDSSGGGYFKINANRTGGGQKNINLDDYRIYTGVLEAKEVQELYWIGDKDSWDDISNLDNSDSSKNIKFLRRHDSIGQYFYNYNTSNVGNEIDSFTISGDKLGFDSNDTYTVHRASVHPNSIDITDNGYHYIGISDISNAGDYSSTQLWAGGDTYIDITTDSNSKTYDRNGTYRYRYSTNGSQQENFSDFVTDVSFDDTVTVAGVQLNFGGLSAIISGSSSSSSGVCILEGSYIMTDQGNKLIEKLNVNNTIHGLPIVDIYRSKACFPFTLFKKGCFGHKIPNKDTYISDEHLVYNSKLKILDNAKQFKNDKTIVKSDHSYNQYCYHIFLKKWSLVKVNNLECETLCVIHPICINYYLEHKLYRKSFIELMRRQADITITLKDIYVKGNKILFKNRIKDIL